MSREIVIVGNGPAGISAALYTVRAGIKTTVIGKDFGALDSAEQVENYYGFEFPISGKELVSAGIKQAKRIGAIMVEDEVVSISFNDTFTVNTVKSEYKADCLILATGSPRSKPNVKGIEELKGKGISYCAVCDAFFYRGKDVAVLGCCEYALSEAKVLLPIVKSVTLITNGKEPDINIPEEIKVITQEIEEINGGQVVESVVFKDSTSIQVKGVFVALGVAGSSELAGKIGALTKDRAIVVDEKMSTNIPGLFACGDCTGGILQISKAVYEGAKSGLEAIQYLQKNEA